MTVKPQLKLGENFLLLPGKHHYRAQAQGYVDYRGAMTVPWWVKARPETIVLTPRGGDLLVHIQSDPVVGQLPSPLQIYVDEIATAGRSDNFRIANINSGTHTILITHPLLKTHQQQFYIEGHGKSQTLKIQLDSNWGWLQFKSAIPKVIVQNWRPYMGYIATSKVVAGPTHSTSK